MEVLPYFKTEYDSRHDPALAALDQAASSCEIAAQRLRASTAVPFSQLDFEAEHPGWSFSAHVTPSGRSSSPKSALKAEPSLKPSASTHSTQGSRKKRGRPRKTLSPEQNQVEPKADLRERKKGKSGRPSGFPGQDSPNYRASSKTTSPNGANRPTAPVQSPIATYNQYGLSNPPSPSRSTQTDGITQAQSRTTDGVEAAIAKSHRDVHAIRLPAAESEEESLRSLYQRSVSRVIESLTRDYEELYPGLDGPALCEEVSQARI